MAKEAMIRARVEASLKEEAEAILSQLGLNATEAITLFYQQVRLQHGLPFAVRLPNEITRQTFERTDAGKDLVRSGSAEEMFEKLGI